QEVITAIQCRFNALSDKKVIDNDPKKSISDS
ncbi:MAG: hypothetical protein ACI9IJ_002136, partial [Psychromonas sp.]